MVEICLTLTCSRSLTYFLSVSTISVSSRYSWVSSLCLAAVSCFFLSMSMARPWTKWSKWSTIFTIMMRVVFMWIISALYHCLDHCSVVCSVEMLAVRQSRPDWDRPHQQLRTVRPCRPCSRHSQRTPGDIPTCPLHQHIPQTEPFRNSVQNYESIYLYFINYIFKFHHL